MKLSLWAVMIASSVGVAFAQATGPGTPDSLDPWLKAGVAVLSLGCLIWVVKYLLTKTIPDQQRTFRETLDKIHARSEQHDAEFRKAMAAQTDSCRQIQKDWADEFRRTKP